MGTASVRRNLFHQNLSRRPASAGPPNGNVPQPNNALSNHPSHRPKPTSSDSSSSRIMKLTENKEIVVRDKNGGYKLDVPSLPHALVGEDGEELGELDAEDAGETGFDSSELSGREKEKILDIVHQSLRKKVASLDDDNWMFEAERDVRF
ncbi:uncharacterized protein N7477_003117 [Penicillium maclennaniae]|uniref:uncharacterized protein n=1 Tax=Penicillium maclennaniae TaxID=1343394 RepID=UPI002542194E|nr:uncharacterized protein N7477_003117 [Penicillium maclennaniae]KAJ5677484.1 hypothetical protein N7477_003117 [Penicillium maclennaniae]